MIPPRIHVLPPPDVHPGTGIWKADNNGSAEMVEAVEYVPVSELERLRSDLMQTIATANGALDLTATETTLRRDLFRVREELRDILWPPPSKEKPHD